MKLHLESLVDGKFSKKTKGSIIMIFLIVPFISSVISMIHVVKFLSLGNTYVVAVTLAITYEIANLTILMAMALMKRLRAFFVWACFVVLLSVQIVGNVYYSYDFILVSIAENSGYLTTFISFIQEMIEFENNRTIVFTLACFLGLPIPMVSLFLVKSVVDYLELGAEEESVTLELKDLPTQTHGLTKDATEEDKKRFDEIMNREKVEFKPEPVTAPTVLEEEPKDLVMVVNESQAAQEITEERKSNSIDFSDTEKLVDQVQEVIEHEPTHLGVTIKPQQEES